MCGWEREKDIMERAERESVDAAYVEAAYSDGVSLGGGGGGREPANLKTLNAEKRDDEDDDDDDGPEAMAGRGENEWDGEQV